MSRSAILIFSAALLLLAGPALAQNLVPNPSFDTAITPWHSNDIVFLAVTLDPHDANGLATSGSAHLVQTDPSHAGYGIQIFTPCIALPASATFSFGAKIFVPSGQESHGRGNSGVEWYDHADCSGNFLGFTGGPNVDSFDAWQESSVSGVTPPVGSRGAIFEVLDEKDEAGGSFTILTDDTFFISGSNTAACLADAHTLCLHGGRFQVTAAFRTPTDSTLTLGTAGTLSDDTGDFWFFSPANIELIVKAVAACVDPFNRYWVFAAGLTNVEVTLTVDDTLSGQVRTYVNPLGTPFAPVQDTQAFATCP